MEKGEIKAATVHEIGVRFEDMLEAGRQEVSKNEGAKLALLMAIRQVNELAAHVDKDLDAGAFNDVTEPMAVATLVKKWLTRTCAVLETGSVSAENHRLIAQGRVQAFQQMIDNMKKLHDMELGKLEAKKATEKTGRRGRATGTRPQASVKQRRLAEEAKAPDPVT